jgi:DNA-binding MarR family transcriptional regulator
MSTTKHTATIEQDVAEFVSLLVKTARDLRGAGPPPSQLRDAVERADLGKRHMPVLLAVAASGPISVSDLAKRVGLLLSTTSTIVGQLNRAGLVDRAEDDHDRRRTIVALHPEYRVAMDAWLLRATAPVRETFQALEPAARVAFIDAWRLLSENAARSASSSETGGCEA